MQKKPVVIKPLPPEKLQRVKHMLNNGEPRAFIATEVGVSGEAVERIASAMGL